MSAIKKQAMAAAATQNMTANHPSQVSADNKRDVDQPMRDVTSDEDQKSPSVGDTAKTSPAASQPNPEVAHGPSSAGQPPPVQPTNDTTPAQPKQPWEYVDEILNVMKTGHPLMILTIETMVDQILQRFKATSEEEIYRLICMLLGDAVQVIGRGLIGVQPLIFAHRAMQRELNQRTMMDSLPL
jgi:transformation/transcription domain-associated protein